MRYILTLKIGGVVGREQQVEEEHSLSEEALQAHMDSMYFGYVEGPNGPPEYPAAQVEVMAADGSKRVFERQAGSNAAGMPDLWVEHTHTLNEYSSAHGCHRCSCGVLVCSKFHPTGGTQCLLEKGHSGPHRNYLGSSWY